MRHTSIATLAAALMMGSASLAYAQDPQFGGGYGQQFGQGGQGFGGGQQFGQGGQGFGGQQFGQGGQGFGGQQQFGGGYGQPFGQGRGQGFGGGQQFGQQGPGGQQFGQGQQGRAQTRSALRRQLRQFGFRDIRILDAAYLVQARTPDGRPVIMVVDPPPRMAGLGSGGQQGQQGQQSQQFGQGRQSQGRQQSGQGGQQSQQFGQGGEQAGQGQDGQQLAQGGQTGTDATGAVGQQGMSQDQIRSLLENRGFENIQSLEREGNAFTAQADWQGEQVDVRVNARTGEITQPEDL